mgnify:FL=1
MKTRQMLLNGECTHREYYSQFVTPSIIDAVKKYIGVNRINKSTDPHLNDIKLAEWDSLAPYVHADFKSYGDSRTLSGCVCILKEAARQIKDGLL